MAPLKKQASQEALTAWPLFLRVTRTLVDAVEADLKTAGLPALAWYDALLELRRAGKAGLRPFELQAHMLLEQYNLSRLGDRLTRAGHVERLPCLEDRRGQRLRITAKGRALLKAMWPVYRAAIVRHFAAKLRPKEVAQLTAVLAKLT